MLNLTSKIYKSTAIYKNRILDKKELENKLLLPEFGSSNFSFLTNKFYIYYYEIITTKRSRRKSIKNM